MRIRALATDYDGTLAADGRVDEATLDALRRLKASGRRLIVVTGRRAEDLLAVFPPAAGLCDRVVAENGGTLCRPASHDERLLTSPVDERLVGALREQGVAPLSVGAAVIGTTVAHEEAALAAARRLGVDVATARNNEALMLLPRGVDKASGLRVALGELGLAPGSVVGVGDAENDVPLVRLCGFGAAVANAAPAVKAVVDLVLRGSCGAGVRELIGAVLGGDLVAAPHGPS